jgi:FlaA1/EpsC-like NDP-sugar epimerase
MRLVVKFMYSELRGTGLPRKKVLIYGAGEAGLIAKRTIDQDAASGMMVAGFIDDNPKKSNKTIEGKTIYPAEKLSEILEKEEINELIISIARLPREKKQEIVSTAISKGVKVLTVPPPKSWINGELSVYQIRNLRIDDLLGREPIQLDNYNVLEYIKGRTVLVTGGAGSIGSELVRQIAYYAPARLVVFDQAESPLYELQQELSRQGMDKSIDWVIGDVRQYDRLKRLFEHFRPQVVFHAAAYKHVPLMEDNPSEAVLANVLGTRNVSDLSDLFNVEKFVFISTDKAVNPTNVMGATKRVAEMYVQSKCGKSKTAYVTTRFGNVLGSTGSVIPLFKRQIEEGGPITITHEEVTRYFMTIPEAVQLVLEAGSMGEGGEIFVFDMGKSVKIIDLARQMIRLSGLEEGKDIRIEISGLRPGEKLYEELLSNSENTLQTDHPKILKARVAELDSEIVARETEELISLFNTQNNERLVAKLKIMVPEYISQNSEFSSLDR